MTQTLKELLSDWTDTDAAQFYLAHCLGVMGPDVSGVANAKHVFWSANPIGDTLYEMLEHLVRIGVLEHDTEQSRFRWNSSFKGSWEK